MIKANWIRTVSVEALNDWRAQGKQNDKLRLDLAGGFRFRVEIGTFTLLAEFDPHWIVIKIKLQVRLSTYDEP